MTDPERFLKRPNACDDTPYERADNRLSIRDIIVLAALAIGGYVVADNYGDTRWPDFDSHNTPAHPQQFCSDEELRQMRSPNPDTCFDVEIPRASGSNSEPSLKRIYNS